MSKAYRSAGVDVEAGYEAVKRMKKHVQSTSRPEVIGGLGGFGGMFDFSALKMKEPVLVSGTDGVGTKLMIAKEAGQHDTVGIDAVAMCVNDILVQGAEPLFFLDYLALGKADPEQIEAIVAGIASGCRDAGCTLIGGETAEMPGMYDADEYDIAGFVVGAAEKPDLWHPERVEAGQALIGLRSSGLHSNGFSLVRKIISEQNLAWNDPAPWDAEITVAEALLTPTSIYAGALKPFFGTEQVKAAAHITGGGLVENVPRMLPDGVKAVIDESAWKLPAVMQWLQTAGNLTDDDVRETFNTGIGIVLAVAEKDRETVLDTLKQSGETAVIIGRTERGEGIEFEGTWNR
ncbi:phosphoribosylformylglycinamidine cyclo-ligase [Salisediminibacterium halotolerans]|uniref:phosphoribosylformylglycinamidine cyclo-ligase n=1 Tax=Salisediminibacterium halotolerans TaxID=517425 RepID=UPI000EB447CF|nr:phosphoribosylformylglycinamidine cyclo-ligase [Salisediminibacterium halotolerans]RLJ71766.1 phosphoribosylformylglycinamidine cyclo-ligase [Actinophytocola xinjiangensis]RPE86916.1 phosphoribosylformylglycinamidine cyclo-ligase [Salisediminibacterium halotolerans]TWG32979.1 phosphoribosylformylglycinamidine cyclo-ligase [Salisediminibacterium halotolerans]GEL08567.1 phosphoribosylformylglycinamidine cyclo-ligase [Salisediminibacterium halotolerans]